MRRGVVLALSTVAVLTFGMASATGEAVTFHYKEFSHGANVVFSPDCPFGDWVPAVDTVCDTYTVWYVGFTKAVDGGPAEPNTAVLHAEIDHETDLVHPDGTGYELAFEFGVAPVAGTFDATHLSIATMSGVDVPMRSVDLDTGASQPNGTVRTLGAFAWTTTSGTYVWGSDGPALGGLRRIATQCENTVELAHQKDAVGSVTGSLDGVSIAADYQLVQIPGLQPANATGYVFDNWFHIADITHCF